MLWLQWDSGNMALGQDTPHGYPTWWSLHSLRRQDSGVKEIEEGGVCLYINWCVNSSAMEVPTHYSLVLEYLMVKCQPFYLPREFSAVIVTVVYIPPQDKKNNKLALNELYKAI